MAECSVCDEEFPDARLQLGYTTCLQCGALEAAKVSEARKKQVAPLFNKGAYQYITSTSQLKDIGRK